METSKKDTKELNSDLIKLGQILRSLRTEKDMSLDQFQTKHGLSRSYISVLEQGKNNISFTQLLRILEMYKLDLVDFAYLFTNKEQNKE